PVPAAGSRYESDSNKCSWRSALTILPSSRALQNFSIARTLSGKFPGQPLRPDYDRERTGAPHEKLLGCSVEQFPQRQTRLPRVPAAPVRVPRLVRNRSTEAFLSWVSEPRAVATGSITLSNSPGLFAEPYCI